MILVVNTAHLMDVLDFPLEASRHIHRFWNATQNTPLALCSFVCGCYCCHGRITCIHAMHSNERKRTSRIILSQQLVRDYRTIRSDFLSNAQKTRSCFHCSVVCVVYYSDTYVIVVVLVNKYTLCI